MYADFLSLKLYVAEDGEVWYLNGNAEPTQSGRSVVSFLTHPLSYEMPRIRIMGLRQNLQLALALYLRKSQTSIEIGGPGMCSTREQRNDPAAALLAMRACGFGGTLGGWHRMTSDDVAHFTLSLQLARCGVNEAVERTFVEHPVWAHLAFIPHLATADCIRLLDTILDPRWFIDPTQAARGSKLRRYLGLDPATMQRVLEAKDSASNFSGCDLRCHICHSAWNGPYDAKLIEKPDHFLLRIKRDVYERTNDEVKANLRATQTFVEYMRLGWLAALGRGRHQTEPLFVPEYFFKEKYEKKAFRDHLKQMNGK